MRKTLLWSCIIGVLAIALALAASRRFPALLTRFHLQPAAERVRSAETVRIDRAPPALRPIFPPPLPAPMAVRSHQAPPPAPGAVASSEALPRLSGIIILGASRQAIFENSSTIRAYGIGERIGAYRISDIQLGSVTVQGPQGPQTLHPGGDTGASQAASPAAAQSSLPSLLDRLNTQPPPVIAVPRPPSLTQMLSRLPKSHRRYPG